MKLQIVLWIVLAMSVAVLVIGCVEWLKRRGHRLVLLGITNVALAINMLLGDSHPMWRYTCLAIVFVLVSTTSITMRKEIRWRSPVMLFAAAAVLLIVVTELLTDFVPGIPKAIVIGLLCALVASIALFIASMFWELNRVFRRGRASRTEMGAATHR